MVNPPEEDPEWPAVRYITNYLDAMENLPDFLAKLTSQMYQLDANCQSYYREFQEHHEVLTRSIDDTCERRQILAKIQNILGHMQDIGDEKLLLMQEIHDVIEKKARALDIDLKNSRLKIEQENSEPVNVSNSNSVDSNPKTSTPNNNEKTVRRGRRAKGDTCGDSSAQAADSSVLSENQTSNLPSTSNGVSRRTSNAGAGKKTKRKSSNNYQNQRQEDEEEGGELLYCICNGVSFGKMICCDNDACLQEWFHFGCVKLTMKPKGKWYCPTCRGSKPHLRKPKSQLR